MSKSVNIRKMLDIIHEAEKQDIEAVVLSLDFVKCFDKCSFSILHGSLEFFGFGDIVKRWTEILYRDFTVKVQNNGHFSQSIDIKKGVHQGGCCSSIYFLVIAEILALALRHNDNIDGLTIHDIRNLLNQFADDMDIFSVASESSIRTIYEELDKFKLQSGFTVSYDKTTMYRIGSLRHSDATMYNLDQFIWSNEDITVLGVTIAHNNVLEKNYQDIVGKAKRVLDSWQNRSLSLMGKVQVINTMVGSLFVYKMLVLPHIPQGVVKKLYNLFREFIWNKKKSKISLRVLQNSKQEGGVNLVNLESKDKALKATWPQILNNECEYAKMVYKIMRCSALQEDIWRCSLKPEDVDHLRIRNDFWRCVLHSWCEYNGYYMRRTENQMLWYNSNIRVGNRPIMWNDVYKQGLKFVHQLFRDGAFKSDEEVLQCFKLTKLRYNSLKAAIPTEWRSFFLENVPQVYTPIPPHNYDMAIHVHKRGFSSLVYKSINGDMLLSHNKFLGWKKELGGEYQQDYIQFLGECNNVYKTTNVPKLRSFQYRTVQRALVTNMQLARWKLIPSNLCTFCHEFEETVSHLFCKCSVIIPLWKDLAEYIKNKYGLDVPYWDSEKVLFNNLSAQKTHIVNFLCLLLKQFIYSKRCLKQAISFPIFVAYLRQTQRIEKFIAVKNDKLLLYDKKWFIKTNEQSESVCHGTH